MADTVDSREVKLSFLEELNKLGVKFSAIGALYEQRIAELEKEVSELKGNAATPKK